MNKTRRDVLRISTGAALGLTAVPFARAQTYPSRTIRIIVATGAGGSTDILARMLGQFMTDRLGQPVVVENRPGGGNNIGTEALVRAAPDGHTLQLANSVNVINTALYDKLSFDFVADTTPIGSFTRSPLVMVINPAIPARSVPEFVAYAKANRGRVNMGSGGVGATGHVAGELFRMMTGIEMTHVPYRGEGPALLDLLAGQVQVSFVTIASAIQYVRAGTLVALATSTATRPDSLPNLPVIGESLPGYEASSWNGVVAPKSTPASIVARLNTEINAALNEPAFRHRLVDMGAIPLGGTAEEFKKLITDEAEKWGKVVKFSGAKAH
jgi:tripartite-type tricarboxylate transporter receptor subunit TctC